MGLSIIARSYLEYVRPLPPEDQKINDWWLSDDDEEAGYVAVYGGNGWPGRLGGMPTGIYRHASDLSETYHFHAGSYGSYHGWKADLCRIFFNATEREVQSWSGKAAEVPFYELIQFSDCEGQIGGKVAEKLYDDFYENLWKATRAAVRYFKDDQSFGEHFLYQYFNWLKAFECATDDGVLEFC